MLAQTWQIYLYDHKNYKNVQPTHAATLQKEASDFFKELQKA